jgi:anti-sigma-K factor RskA
MADQMDERNDPHHAQPPRPILDHEAIRDDLAGYALGVLDRAATTRLEAHLPTCPACAAALADYQAVLRILPLGLPASQPPAGARARLLARARAAPAPARLRPPRLAFWRRTSSHRLALLATLLLVVTGAGVAISGEFGEGTVPERWEVVMEGSAGAPDGVGRLVYPRRPGDPPELAELIVSGLRVLPPDRSYQLWFVAPDQRRVSGGVFGVDAGGRAVMPLVLPPDFRSFVACDVSLEPAGGSPAPTGPTMLHGEWD